MAERTAPVSSWWNDVTAGTAPVTRSFVLSLIPCYLAQAFLGQYGLAVQTDTYHVVLHFEVYRVFISFMFQKTVLGTILACFFLYRIGNRMEATKGSLAFATLLLSVPFCVNVLFLLLMTTLAYNPLSPSLSAVVVGSQGMWAAILGLMVIDCHLYPDLPRRLFVWTLSSAWLYPWVMLLLFTIFSGVQLDLFIGIFVGYLFAKGHMATFEPSERTLKAWETGSLSTVANWRGYVSVEGAGAVPDFPTTQVESGQGGSAAAAGAGGPSNMFSGLFSPRAATQGTAAAATGASGGGRGFSGRGHVLGSDPLPTAPIAPSSARVGRPEHAPFPGRGHTLGGGGSSGGLAAARPAPHRGLLPYPTAPLAPLTDPVSGDGGAFRWESECIQLQGLGYSAADSRKALVATRGDANAAASILLGTGSA